MPVLQLDDIQGDVLVGLQKERRALSFFRIIDSRCSKPRCEGRWFGD